jgi:hypothetical protein
MSATSEVGTTKVDGGTVEVGQVGDDGEIYNWEVGRCVGELMVVGRMQRF